MHNLDKPLTRKTITMNTKLSIRNLYELSIDLNCVNFNWPKNPIQKIQLLKYKILKKDNYWKKTISKRLSKDPQLTSSKGENRRESRGRNRRKAIFRQLEALVYRGIIFDSRA